MMTRPTIIVVMDDNWAKKYQSLFNWGIQHCNDTNMLLDFLVPQGIGLVVLQFSLINSEDDTSFSGGKEFITKLMAGFPKYKCLILCEDEKADKEFYRIFLRTSYNQDGMKLANDILPIQDVVANKEVILEYYREFEKQKQLDDIQWDDTRSCVLYHQKPLDFPNQELTVLKLLLENKGKLVSYEKLSLALWNESRGIKITSKNVSPIISRIKKILKEHYYPNAETAIKVITNEGYRFDG